MSIFPSHVDDFVLPDDVFIEVTALGDSEPQFLLARGGLDTALCQLKMGFAFGLLSLEFYEQLIERAFQLDAQRRLDEWEAKQA